MKFFGQDEKDPTPIKGDPDFAEVARERLGGPADYDESSGNEIVRQEPSEESGGAGEGSLDEESAGR